MGIASSIALSGMMAASTRLRVAASNIANASSSGPLPSAANASDYPAAYTAQRVDTVDIQGGGTRAIVRNASPGTVAKSDSTAPYADSNGMVASPNVDLGSEAVDVLSARLSFAMNAFVVRAESQMMKSLLDIKT